MERAILARHAESEFSAVGIVNGDPSVAGGLTERGRAEARRLGDLIADEDIGLCVTTEFPRTIETADVALAGRAVPRLVVRDLNDPRLGALEGCALAELRAWLTSNGPSAAPTGGETRISAVRRYCRGFRTVLDRPERTVLIIAHGLPVTLATLATTDRALPLSLEGVQVEHAAPHSLSSAELERSVERMEAWADEVEAA